MKPLWQIADFVRELRRQLRFGEFSRAPLQLLRLELHDKALACDWMARPGDVWDHDLRQHVRDRNESQQALADAITIRDLVFSELPEVKNALLRAFRFLALMAVVSAVFFAHVYAQTAPAPGLQA